MAIKGKKPKARSGRVVTAGPRPAYVPPKVPLMQRTGAKFLVALVAETIFFALLVGFGEQSRAERQGENIEEYSALLEASLARAGESIQLLPGGTQILPQLPPRLTELQEGIAPEEDAVLGEAESWVSAMNGAANAILEIQVEYDVLDLELRRELADARDLIERSLRLHAGLAEQVKVVAQIDGDPQRELITTILEQLPVATIMFDAGYNKLQDVRIAAGLPATTGIPSGVPGGFPGAPPGTEFPFGEDPQIVPAPPAGGGGQGGGDDGGGGRGGGGNG